VYLVKLKFGFFLLCDTEWWRTADSHSRSGAAFFPPLLGISPLFAPPAQNHDSTPFHPRTTGKNNRGSLEKGNGQSYSVNNCTLAQCRISALLLIARS